MNTPIRTHGDGTCRDLELEAEHERAKARWRRIVLLKARETDVNYALNEYMTSAVQLKRYREGL